MKAFKAWLQNLDLPFSFVRDCLKAEKEMKTLRKK